MEVRVIRDCSHPTVPGGRMCMLREDAVFEWGNFGYPLPAAMEPVNASDKLAVEQERLEGLRAELEAAEKIRHEKARENEVARLTTAVIVAEDLVAALEAGDTDDIGVVDEAPAKAHPSLHASDRDSQIVMAFGLMDHSDDDQWTSQGLPRVEVVSAKLAELGFDPEVTRDDIKVAQLGFQRE